MRVYVIAAVASAGVLASTGVLADAGRSAQSAHTDSPLRAVLLQELRETHNQKNWFVSEKEATAGLTPEQAAWNDGKNHGVGQLVAHLNYWNEANLAGLKHQPGSRAVLCGAWSNFTGREQDTEIAVLDLKTRKLKTLVHGGFDPTYLPSGHMLYRAAGTLFVIPFDADRLQVTGEPRRIADTLTVGDGYAASASGTLAILPTDTRRSLVWIDRNGRETPTGPRF